MAETLASSLNPSPFNPIGAAASLLGETDVTKRGKKARELQPEFIGEQSAAEAGLMREEAGAKRRQVEQETEIERGFERGVEAAGRAYQGAVGQAPERQITAFNPEKGIELASLTAIMGAFAGAISGRAGLAAMEGVSEGYRKGQQDLYERQVQAYNAEVDKYKQKVNEAKQIYDNAIKLEGARRGAGMAELKKLEPLLQDSVITAHLRVNDFKGAGAAINEAIKLADQLELKRAEAGLKPTTMKFQTLVDPEGKQVIMNVSDPTFRAGEVGEGRGGFIGYAAPKGKAGQSAEGTKEGERKFAILTDQLRQVYTDLQSQGEIRSVQNIPTKNLWVYLKTTGVGQEIQRALGSSPQSLRDYTGGLRASLMNAIREATGMGARSLDSNKELEFYLQAVTDPTATVESNFSALQNLEALYGNLKSIADSEGLDDARVVEGAISKFGSHEPHRYKYVMVDGMVTRTPRNKNEALQTGGAQPSAAPRQMSQQDQQALEWANANPDDPRAAQIKQRLGAQ